MNKFVWFCVATFASFLGTSSISFFSVVLLDLGISLQESARILGAPFVPVVVCILLSGELVRRFGALRLAVFGQVLTCLAYWSFIFTMERADLAVISRFIAGMGFGVFFPAALVYARSLVDGKNSAFLFGIYSTMIPLPNLIGPGMAEAIYRSGGYQAMIIVCGVPIVFGLAVSLVLPNDVVAAAPAKPKPFLEVALNKASVVPNAAIVIVGLLWGFMLSFMALFLSKRGIESTIFFSSATLALVVSRFTVMAWVGGLERSLVCGFGLLLMSLGYVCLVAIEVSSYSVLWAASIFGLGYSFVFPVLSLWATDGFPVAERARPMAVFSALFQAGIFALPLLVAVGADLSIDACLYALSVASVIVGCLLFAHGLHRQFMAFCRKL
jgi:MFS family permease